MLNRLITLFFVFLFSPGSASSDFAHQLAAAALERTRHTVTYDGSYRQIAYPGGDVPTHIGVCTDLVIRSYRAVGIDLQKRVHEDMSNHFNAYPSEHIWGLHAPDNNIDHRRVPNLQTFFSRHGTSLLINTDTKNFLPGDIVTWMLPGNLPHIGIVSDVKDTASAHPLIIHNIGQGPALDNMLFKYTITGHYRYADEY